MKNAELKEAIDKYIESKELILMGYSPEYIDDVKTDMETAFRAGAKWMAEKGETITGIITKVGDKLDVETTEYLIPEESEFERGDRVVVQIRKK